MLEINNNNNLENNNLNEKLKMQIRGFISEISKKINQKNEILVIDRFEGEFAVCENRNTGKIKHIKCEQLPQNAKEGNVLIYKNNKYELDIEKEQEISKTIEEKMNDIWEE